MNTFPNRPPVVPAESPSTAPKLKPANGTPQPSPEPDDSVAGEEDPGAALDLPEPAPRS